MDSGKDRDSSMFFTTTGETMPIFTRRYGLQMAVFDYRTNARYIRHPTDEEREIWGNGTSIVVDDRDAEFIAQSGGKGEKGG